MRPQGGVVKVTARHDRAGVVRVESAIKVGASNHRRVTCPSVPMGTYALARLRNK